MEKRTFFLILAVIILRILSFTFIFAQNTTSDEKIINYKPEEVKVIHLPAPININCLNYGPTLINDDNLLLFVSDRDGSKKQSNGDNSHDFWVAGIIDDTTYDEPFNLDLMADEETKNDKYNGINTEFNEGVGCYSNKLKALIFTGCNRQKGVGSCDIYCSLMKNGKFTSPINLGPGVNSKYWESQPSIGQIDNRIYFVSSMPGPNSNGYPNKLNYDIWYSDFDTVKKMRLEPQNINEINTLGQECSPYIAPDGLTLFFSSTEFSPNYGGLDLYVTRYNPALKKWSKPENLGKPINSDSDDVLMTMPASGDCFYFSSNRDAKYQPNHLSIYKAILPKPILKTK